MLDTDTVGGRYAEKAADFGENIIIKIIDMAMGELLGEYASGVTFNYLILTMKASFEVRREMAPLGHNRKSVTATRMSAYGGRAEVDFGWLEVCL